MPTELSWETLTGIASGAALLLGGMALKFGPFTIVVQRRKTDEAIKTETVECPSPECHEELVHAIQQVRTVSGEVQHIKEKVDKLDDSVRDIYPKINATAEGVMYIKGRMEGLRRGNNH